MILRTTFLLVGIAYFVLPSFAQQEQQAYPFSPNVWLNGHELKTTLQEATILERSKSSDVLINFNPTIQVGKEQGHLEIPYPIDEMTRFTFISVCQATDGSQEQAIWATKNSHRDILFTTQRITNPEGVANYRGGNITTPALSTIVQRWGNPSNTSIEEALMLGNLPKPKEEIAPFTGSFAEYLVFDRSLTTEEREQIETYLAIKYGITLVHDYVNSSGQVIWDISEQDEYKDRITSIGRDDVYQLYQKQSKSTQEGSVLSIGIGAIASNNASNNSDLENEAYLLWADDNAPFALPMENVDMTADLIPLERNWLIKSVNQNESIATEVQFDLSDVEIPEGYEPVLLINRAGKQDFLDEKVERIGMSNLDATTVSFKQVFWDTDASGTDVFALAFARIVQPIVSQFKLSPNPSNGVFDVAITLEEVSDVRLRVFDITGKLIVEMEGDGASVYQFDGKVNGVGEYVVELQTKQGKQSKTLLVTK